MTSDAIVPTASLISTAHVLGIFTVRVGFGNPQTNDETRAPNSSIMSTASAAASIPGEARAAWPERHLRVIYWPDPFDEIEIQRSNRLEQGRFSTPDSPKGCAFPCSEAEFPLNEPQNESDSASERRYISCMTSHTPPSLGILNLERGLQPGAPLPAPRPSSLMNPATHDFPVIVETVEGAWAENVIRGDPALEPACIAAAQRLVERGAIAISANCGFFIRHQAAVAASVGVPVVMSALLLLPGLLRQLPKAAKLAVLTADSTHLGEDLLGIDDPAERMRLVIGGTEGGELWRNELKRPPPITEITSVEKDVTACIVRLRAAHPEIAAILFECTGFPMVASAMRRVTKLPIYDITTLCRLTIASVG